MELLFIFWYQNYVVLSISEHKTLQYFCMYVCGCFRMVFFHVADIRLRAAFPNVWSAFCSSAFSSLIHFIRQVHSLFQSEFFTELLYPVFCLSCNKLFYKADPTQDVTNPVLTSPFFSSLTGPTSAV